jgi:glutathionyl-hydroquinone reductase
MVVSRTALDEMGADGSFNRRDAAWRDWIGRDEDAKFKAEPDRYHLFVAYACPWASRTLMTRAMKGLEDVISTTLVMPVWKKTRPDDPEDKHNGWVFADPDGEPYKNTIGLGGPFPASLPENEPEPFYNVKSIRELYERAGDTDGKYTVPVLWDKKTNTIVSNESADIIKMLNSEFNEFAKNPDLNLNPEELQHAMEEVDSWIYPNINNGVYRCGFAKSQTAYDEAIEGLTQAFDKLETILSKQRYIAGSKVTLSDVRLFVTLVRYDEVYHVYFKTNTRSITESSVLLNYVREIYQMPGVKETVNMTQIKMHYYCSHPDFNKFSIIPKGNDFESLLKLPHNRDQLFSKKRLVGDDSKMTEEKKEA